MGREITLFELLAQDLGREKAKSLVAFVEAKVDKKVVEKQNNVFAHIDTKIAETKAEILKWVFAMFIPFYVGMIVFLIKPFL